MPKSRPPYSPEFRRQMVELVRAGRSPEDLAREFEPTAQSIGNWVAQADKQEGRREEAAMEMAVGQRRPKDVIHHSDQGSQGGSNRSSQHRPELIVARRRGPRRAFSNQAFCAVCR